MVDNLADSVPTETMIDVLIVLALLVFLFIEIAPKINEWLQKWRSEVNTIDDLGEGVSQHTSTLEEVKQRQDRDYKRINAIERDIQAQKEYISDSLEERELILRSLLGLAQGLQELGANGPTKEVERNIQEYLIKITHKMLD